MAEAMIILSTLPLEEQEEILEQMSLGEDEIVSIEINGEVYRVSIAVMGLIESLHEELVRYRLMGNEKA
tara:strand:+ start:1039 stop:1245 length:207 start_codon:yes stop_codon:yes gene_type:complete